MELDLLIVCFGLGVGILVGMTGIGGGSIMTPLLILVIGTQPAVAIGTDLAYAAVTKTLGGWRHLRRGGVDLPISAWLAVGSIPGALGGVYVLRLLERAVGAEFDSLLIGIVAAAILLTGAATLGRALFRADAAARERETVPMDRRHKVAAVLIGVSVGFVLGLTSAGSGALIALGLIIVFRLTPHRVVGTDVFHAAVLLWAAAFAHLVSGNVDLALMATLLLGSLPGVWLGAHFAVKASPAFMRHALGIVLLVAGMALLTKAGLGIPTAVIPAAAVSLCALAAAVNLSRARPQPA